MPQNLINEKSLFAQLTAWCRQAIGHYLGQCWQILISLYDVTRPQWVKVMLLEAKDLQYLSYTVNTMDVDDLAMQVTMILA